jgi:hypothetical protein
VGHKRTPTLMFRPLGVDAVDKVTDYWCIRNNRIQALRSLNQCCAPISYFYSMLLTPASKNVYRQHRSNSGSCVASASAPLCREELTPGRRGGVGLLAPELAPVPSEN